MDLSDEDVIRRVQRGETELFDLVFERNYTRIERYLRHLGMAAFPPELARWRETHHSAHTAPAEGMGAVFDGH